MSDLADLDLHPYFSTVELPVRILARETKQLRNMIIPLVKVQWSSRGIEESSWEREEDMRKDFLQLFEEEVQRSVVRSFFY